MSRRLSEYLSQTAAQFFKNERQAIIKALGKIPAALLGTTTPKPGQVLYADGVWNYPDAAQRSLRQVATRCFPARNLLPAAAGVPVNFVVIGK